MKQMIKKILSTIRHSITYDIMNIREMDRYIRDNLNDACSTFCEIGVYKGYHAKRMLLYHSIKSMYLIEPIWKLRTIKKFKRYSFITMVNGKSADVANSIPHIDVIYVDGDHSYDGVKSDLLLYFGKAMVIFGGHDFTLHGVHSAVMEFCAKNNLVDKLVVNGNDWWIVKEGNK